MILSSHAAGLTAMSGWWDRFLGAVEPLRQRWDGVASRLKGDGGGPPREPLANYYIADHEVIRLSLAIGGLENFLSRRANPTASEGRLWDAARGWFHAFPGYHASQPEVTGVLLALNRWETAELRNFAEVVEGALLCAGLEVPYLVGEPMIDRIQKRGEELRWDLSLAVQQFTKESRKESKALGVFASNREVWNLHIAVNALKVLASKIKPDWEFKRFLFDLESALIPAGRPDRALKGAVLDLNEEQRALLREAERAVWDVVDLVLRNGGEEPRIRWGRKLDEADALIDALELLLAGG